LYFDGKKDRTLTITKLGNKWYKKTVIEEHLSLIREPDSTYIGHVTPLSGSAEDVKDSIIGFFRDRYDKTNSKHHL